MKTKRFLLAAAIAMAAAACSRDVVAPEAAVRAPASAHTSTAVADSSGSDPSAEQGGYLGSGVGK